MRKTSLMWRCDCQTAVRCAAEGRRWIADQFKAQPRRDEHSINPWIKINQFGVCGWTKKKKKKKGHPGKALSLSGECAPLRLCVFAPHFVHVYRCVYVGVHLCVCVCVCVCVREWIALVEGALKVSSPNLSDQEDCVFRGKHRSALTQREHRRAQRTDQTVGRDYFVCVCVCVCVCVDG